MRKKENGNIYDKFLILLIFLLGFGGIGGALRLSRIAAIAFLPLLAAKYERCLYAKRASWIFLLFYFYCLISIIWTPDKDEGLVELVYYPVHFVLFLEIVIFAGNSRNALKSISIGWLLAVVFCCSIAFWELVTGNHLSITKEQKDVWNTGTEIITYLRSNATFYNSNGFVTFLCFSMPWLFYGFRLSNGFYKKLLFVLVIVIAIIISLLNGSRGGLLSIMIMSLIFIVMSFKDQRKRVINTLLLILAFYAIYYFYTNSMFAVMTTRVSDSVLSGDDARFVIWNNALKAFGDTYGLGTGIGGMHEAMKEYALSGIVITHNIFLEFFLQYGIIFGSVFVYFLWCQFKKALQLGSDRKMALLMALIAMPVYGVINSGYLLDAHLYGLLATIFVFANYERIKISNKVLYKTA